MPQLITTNITASGSYTVQTTQANDFIYVAQGVLASNIGPVSPAYSTLLIGHSGTSVGIAGTVFSGATSALYLTATNANITVASTGTVQSLSTSWETIYATAAGTRVYNHGQILSNSRAIFDFTNTTLVVNSGLIQAMDTAILGAAKVINTGTIHGIFAISMTANSDYVQNLGTIIGNVELGNGTDIFDTIGGAVAGTVFGGAGDDTYRVSQAADFIYETFGNGTDTVESTVSQDLGTLSDVENLTLLGTARDGFGNELHNTLRGNLAANQLLGQAGNDTIHGGAGQDTLDGGIGNDSLMGDFGNDRILGRAGVDTVYGGDGDDWIHGGAAGDLLYGGGDDDTLIGGAGRDVMYGGADSDTFVFLAASDSGSTGLTRDVINAFEAGIDVIDLARVDANTALAGDQAFTFLGGGAFTNVAGQLRFGLVGGLYILEGDLDGNGSAEFQVRITGVTSMLESDLIL